MSRGLAIPPIVELVAPPLWQAVDFIADLHLQAAEPATFAAWRRYLDNTPADALFILGDLFEAWIGDDVACVNPLDTAGHEPNLRANSSFEAYCVQTLSQAAQHLDVFFMHGNRDFLVGPALMKACNATLLDDPTVLTFGGQRWLLSHGDMLCMGDTDYRAFRQQVRSPVWQQVFLAKPLAERQALARGLREQSQMQHQRRRQAGIADVDIDPTAAQQWLATAKSRTLIHGHTHKPARHELGDGYARVVLSDWDATAKPPRLEALRLTAQGLRRISLSLA